MSVRLAETVDDFDDVHALARAHVGEGTLCWRSDSPYPSRNLLSRLAETHRVVMAYDGDELIGTAVYDTEGWVVFSLAVPGRWVAVATEIVGHIVDTCGRCQGDIPDAANPVLAAAIRTLPDFEVTEQSPGVVTYRRP